MKRKLVLPAAAVFALILSVVLLVDHSSSLESSATTEEGFFQSGTARLSYALDISIIGYSPYPLAVFGHESGPNTKNEANDWTRRLVKKGIAVFRLDRRQLLEERCNPNESAVPGSLRA